MLQSVKTFLGKCFPTKDMGDSTYIHAIRIYKDRSKRLIGPIQRTYLEKIMNKFMMKDSKRGFVPMQHVKI